MRDINLELYKDLYLCRRAEELIIEHYEENEMRTPMHMSFGQEAIAVGVCAALGENGQVFSSYRSHASFLAKTHDADMFFRELYGRVGGTAEGKGGSMHLVCAEKGFLGASGIVASTIPTAVGASFANKRLGNDKIVAVFFGDGAVDEGVFWESLNVACLYGLPVLFVCEDNRLAVYTPKYLRRSYNLMAAIGAYECYSASYDTTNVEEIRKYTAEALVYMKENSSPSFLNFSCCRYLEHVGVNSDFDVGYRSHVEYDEWYERDPLKLQRDKLLDAGISEHDIRNQENVISLQLELALKHAKDAPSPSSDALMHGVFHETD